MKTLGDLDRWLDEERLKWGPDFPEAHINLIDALRAG